MLFGIKVNLVVSSPVHVVGNLQSDSVRRSGAKDVRDVTLRLLNYLSQSCGEVAHMPLSETPLGINAICTINT